MANKTNSADVRNTEANPEKVDFESGVFEPTDAEKKDAEGRSEFEQVTGVKEEELDTRPVVDADPGAGKTFDERTSADQPWREYQEHRSEVIAEGLRSRTGDSDKLTADSDKKSK